jgi:D-proline reductase (dithiol) PrdA
MGGAAGAEAPAAVAAGAVSAAAAEVEQEPKLIRTLTRKHYNITEVKRGPETKIEGTVLTIREGIEKECIDSEKLVYDLKIDIITPADYHTYSETIMDVQPIATKEGEDELGSGTTRVLDGVIMMVTGTDANGVQIGEFGSSEGYLDENIMWGRPGAPEKGEIFIKTQVTVKEHTNMERPGPLAAHRASDIITQEIREALKKVEDESLVVDTETFEQYRRPGKKKVVIVKEIMGQGAMHDNLILPVEPVGVLGAKPNVDLGNVPVAVSPLEVLDGCIHALTCIGPASKEMSRHYWREPLVLEALHDEELDLCGVIFVGSPQINAEKFYVSKRVGQICEMLDVDGAFVTTEGFGNNHIDFASHHEQIGMRGIPVVGLSFCAVQGALVVGNKYMTHMIDNNKSESGIENEVLACNTLCPEEAIRAVQMLKNAMGGEEVKAAERKWNPNVKSSNVEAIEGATDKKFDLVKNEQSLPMSQKRKDKYD